jgi:hypothetical protein
MHWPAPVVSSRQICSQAAFSLKHSTIANFGDLSGQFSLALSNDYYTLFTYASVYCDLQHCGFIP